MFPSIHRKTHRNPFPFPFPTIARNSRIGRTIALFFPLLLFSSAISPKNKSFPKTHYPWDPSRTLPTTRQLSSPKDLLQFFRPHQIANSISRSLPPHTRLRIVFSMERFI